MRLDDAPRAAWMTRLQNDMRRAVARHILREAIASGRLRISGKASKILDALSEVGGMSNELQQEASRWQQARAKLRPYSERDWELYVAHGRKRATRLGITTIEALEGMAEEMGNSLCATCNGTRRIPWPEAGMMQDCPDCRAKP